MWGASRRWSPESEGWHTAGSTIGRTVSDPPVGFGVIGERVALGPLRPELYPLHVAWVNDADVAWNVFARHEPRSEAEETVWLERERSKPDARFWLVYRLDEDR